MGAVGFLFRPPIFTTFIEPGAPVLPGVYVGELQEFIKGILLQIDATVRLTHSLATNITDFPLEDGESASDNAVKQPRRLVIEGSITDTPTTYTVIGYVPSSSFIPGIMPRAVRAFQEILNLWKTETPFDIITPKDYYKSMLIENFVSDESAQIGKRLSFTMNLKQVRIIEDETVSALDDLALPNTDLGYLAFKLPDTGTAVGGALFLAKVLL